MHYLEKVTVFFVFMELSTIPATFTDAPRNLIMCKYIIFYVLIDVRRHCTDKKYQVSQTGDFVLTIKKSSGFAMYSLQKFWEILSLILSLKKPKMIFPSPSLKSTLSRGQKQTRMTETVGFSSLPT